MQGPPDVFCYRPHRVQVRFLWFTVQPAHVVFRPSCVSDTGAARSGMELAGGRKAHVNPVYGSYFADPFVWEHEGVYFAIGTGSQEAEGHTLGKVFPVLQSPDFFQWRFASNALIRPDPHLGSHFWAPAVAFNDGTFYLYYSVGHGDKGHHLRVATSAAPQGPYQDIGNPLMDPAVCAFAIDPHPFQDEDGERYLFYARDFLDTQNGFRVGTGIAAARMSGMTRLESPGQVIMRPRYDWQRFQDARSMYGQVWDWHTLEGPCVRRHGRRYYCFLSGGHWETDAYGIDYATADEVLGAYSEAGGENGPRVLRTLPGRLLGPGHNSIVDGPNGEQYIVYHAWDRGMKARQMFIDRLFWNGDEPRCDGPTWGSAWRP